MEIIAHRGYSARAPENTLAALRMAAEAGAHALEFDVHMTADGVPVLHHDFTLERTTGSPGRLDETRFEELRDLDAGSWFDEGFAAERVPAVDHALRLAAAHRTPAGTVARVYPELKGWRDEAELEHLLALVRRHGWERHCCIISLDWDALLTVRRRAPELAVGFVYEDARLHHEAVALAADIGNAIVDPDRLLLLDEPERARYATARGVELACWTVNDAAEAHRLADMGVGRITTDEVERMLREFPGAGS